MSQQDHAVKNTSNAEQQLPGFRDLGLMQVGGKIHIFDSNTLFDALRFEPVPFTTFPLIVVPSDALDWGFVSCRGVDQHPEPQITPPIRIQPQWMTNFEDTLAERRIRKLVTYMPSRTLAMIAAIKASPSWPQSDIDPAKSAIPFLEGKIERCAKSEQMWIESIRSDLQDHADEWKWVCDTLATFDQGWLTYAEVPVDELIPAE